MALSYGTVKYGSSGDDVRELQRRLNGAGYNVAVDGNFGNQTQQAVRDYQRDKNLTIDGIVGSQTWGSLTGTGAATGQSMNLQDVTSRKPGAYQSRNQGLIDQLYDQIVNRKPFQFNLEGNALYEQYKDSYKRMGQQAMQDTMGQAAGLTGGYGSSYSQNVGQQAYNAYMQQLNDIVPDIYAQELSRYDQDAQNLYNQYSLLQNRESQDYAMWADAYDRWFAEYQLAQDQSNWQKQFDMAAAGSGSGSGRGSGAADETGPQLSGHLASLAKLYVDEEGGSAAGMSEYLKDNGYSEEYIDSFYELVMLYQEQKRMWLQNQQKKRPGGKNYSFVDIPT